MKKKLCVLLCGLCLVSVSACGSNNLDNISVSSEGGGNSIKEDINIKDITWDVDEGIVDGERYILLNYKNNTPYTIADFKITFKEKSSITEKEKSTFYSDMQKEFEASDADDEDIKEVMEELKNRDISMYAETEMVINPGESATNINCYYYDGYYYLKDINHYKLVEPDIATIKYVNEDNIFTVYYDYNSKKYSAESETKVAYQWTQTDLGNKIPKPDVKIVESNIDNEKIFMFDACGISLEQFNAYVEECKTLGYTIESNSFEGFYSADNAEGYNIYMHYDKDDYEMRVTVKNLSDGDV